MNHPGSKTLVAIVGPTAVGKTDVAMTLAKKFKSDIVSADSRQIYKELVIGTAKPSNSQLAEVTHHFVNYKSIGEHYDAGEYGREAVEVIKNLFLFMDVLLLCGGSGLYVKAICEGFDDMPEVPEATRKILIKNYEEKGVEWLQDELRTKDPDYFSVVDIHNPHRLIRALELIDASGMQVGHLRRKKKLKHDFNIVKVGLELDRDELYKRIDDRVDKMISGGLVEEAREFHSQQSLNSLQTVGYKEIFGYLGDEYDLTEAIRLLKRNTRRYAKRQLTWFKKDSEVKWFNADDLPGIMQHLKEYGLG
jgi:tRNA dimethylallyltransferase